MATIRKLRSGRFNVQVRRAGRPPLSDTFDSKTEAKAWGAKIDVDIGEGKHYGFSRVSTLADTFVAVKTTIKTAADRKRQLCWWRERFGKKKLFHFAGDVVEEGGVLLGAKNIERNPDKPPRCRSPQTVRHYLMALSACMDHAKRKKRWIQKNPVADIDAPAVSPGRIRWLSQDERKRFLAACDRSGNPDLIEIRYTESGDTRFNADMAAFQVLCLCDIVFPQPSAFVRITSIT